MASERVQARGEILTALGMLLGEDGARECEPSMLEALHSLAIAAREYLLAEQASELEQGATVHRPTERHCKLCGNHKWCNVRGLCQKCQPVACKACNGADCPVCDWTGREPGMPAQRPSFEGWLAIETDRLLATATSAYRVTLLEAMQGVTAHIVSKSTTVEVIRALEPVSRPIVCTSCDDNGCGFCVPCEPWNG